MLPTNTTSTAAYLLSSAKLQFPEICFTRPTHAAVAPKISAGFAVVNIATAAANAKDNGIIVKSRNWRDGMYYNARTVDEMMAGDKNTLSAFEIVLSHSSFVSINGALSKLSSL